MLFWVNEGRCKASLFTWDSRKGKLIVRETERWLSGDRVCGERESCIWGWRGLGVDGYILYHVCGDAHLFKVTDCTWSIAWFYCIKTGPKQNLFFKVCVIWTCLIESCVNMFPSISFLTCLCIIIFFLSKSSFGEVISLSPNTLSILLNLMWSWTTDL